MSEHETEKQFAKLLEVMAQLRSEKSGCPWDREQTHHSLKPCLLEETYELIDALDSGDANKVKEELGDVLLQVIFHAQIAREGGNFTIKEVIEILTEKLMRRHPYVFAGEPLPEGPAAALKQRAQIKANEKISGDTNSALGNVPKAMPALARAQSISRRAAGLGFEWPDIDQVWNKVDEEMIELREAVASGNKAHSAAELGDLLFTLVNIARFLDLEAEEALAHTVDRFTRRFQHIEEQLRIRKRDFAESSIEELEGYWSEAKRLETQGQRTK